jgi:hypothetical protein
MRQRYSTPPICPGHKSISREYQRAWRSLPRVRNRMRLAQKIRRLWRRLDVRGEL